MKFVLICTLHQIGVRNREWKRPLARPERRWEGKKKKKCGVRMYCVFLVSERQYLLWPVTYFVYLMFSEIGIAMYSKLSLTS